MAAGSVKTLEERGDPRRNQLLLNPQQLSVISRIRNAVEIVVLHAHQVAHRVHFVGHQTKRAAHAREIRLTGVEVCQFTCGTTLGDSRDPGIFENCCFRSAACRFGAFPSPR